MAECSNITAHRTQPIILTHLHCRPPTLHAYHAFLLDDHSGSSIQARSLSGQMAQIGGEFINNLDTLPPPASFNMRRIRTAEDVSLRLQKDWKVLEDFWAAPEGPEKDRLWRKWQTNKNLLRTHEKYHEGWDLFEQTPSQLRRKKEEEEQTARAWETIRLGDEKRRKWLREIRLREERRLASEKKSLKGRLRTVWSWTRRPRGPRKAPDEVLRHMDERWAGRLQGSVRV